jgi:outer membrane protein insertion porin family
VSTAQEARRYGFQFVEPSFLGRDVRFGLQFDYSQTDSEFATFDSEKLLFQPSLTFPVSENGRLQLRYTLEQLNVLERDPKANGLVIGEDIKVGEQLSSSVGYTYRYDTRITGLNPDAGVLFEFAQDFAGLGGDSKYVKTTANVVGQRSVLNGDVVLRATLEGGAIAFSGGSNRAADRFLLGPNELRGFEPGGIGPREDTGDSLGGNLFIAARLEAEFPLGLPEEYGIRGSVFYDVGNLWDLSDVNLGGATVNGEGGSLRHVIGVGVLWDTPIGPLRFNFTDALRKETYDREQTFDLTLSTSF